MAECGTYYGYRKGCRCDDCRTAHATKCREYREAMVAKHGYIPSQRNRKARPRKNWVCAECGKAIKSNAGNARDGRILCKEHRAKARRVTRRQAAKLRLAKAKRGTTGRTTWTSSRCKVCNKHFITNRCQSLCCSSACSVANKTDQMHTKRQRRRATKRSAFVSNVSPRKVFEADGYRCHICKRMTDPRKKVPHPRAPTVDHVIPLARNGTHEPLNCRTACFICNATKSDRGGGEQMLLLA